MIIHYHPETFSITGMGSRPSQNNPWIETDDEIALQIFQGKEKVLNYVVVVKSKENNQGFLKKKSTINKSKSISERLFLIPNKIVNNAEFSIRHNVLDKTISVSLSETASIWWHNDINFRNIVVAACVPNDPFQVLWSFSVTTDSIDKPIIVNYSGTDDICFFTEKIFESYSYEQIT